MSITAETAKAHAKDPAVLCCRAEEGITIEAANLEDPAIFDDLVDSGLLNLEGVLTIEQVLGAKLKKTCDSLTALTPDVVEGYKEVAAEEPVEEETPKAEEVPAEAPCRTGSRSGRSVQASHWRRKGYQSGDSGWNHGGSSSSGTCGNTCTGRTGSTCS